jgi:hypothetical protein
MIIKKQEVKGMKKINAYNPKTKEIETSGYFASFKQAREYFAHYLTGFYYLCDDSRGMEIKKRAFFK